MTEYTTEKELKTISKWDLINGKKYPWGNNPWVWVIEFRKVE